MNFTKFELLALNEIRYYGHMLDQMDDNMSECDVADIAKGLGISRNAAGGVVSSLIDKNVCAVFDGLVWLNEGAIPSVYKALKEAGFEVEVE